ncbi:MAG: hypothetical protein OHK0011_16770 [Turneriella sp.]
MQQLVLFFFGLLLAGSATLLGVVSVFHRTAGSPDYYAGAINQVRLSGFAVPLAAKLTGTNSKVSQVLQLGMNRLEPQLKQQTAEHLRQLFPYLRGKTEQFNLVYDMSAGLSLLFVVLTFLVARSIAQTIIATAIAFFVAACLLMLPWLFSDAIVAAMRLKGSVYEWLQQTGLWQALAADLRRSYHLSPMSAAATAAVCPVDALAVRRLHPESAAS